MQVSPDQVRDMGVGRVTVRPEGCVGCAARATGGGNRCNGGENGTPAKAPEDYLI